MEKILIASPIKQKSNILSEFLKSLDELNKSNLDISYYFVDDNNTNDSKELLNAFFQSHNNVILKTNNDFQNINKDEYICNNQSHLWKSTLIQRIIEYKNAMLKYAFDNDFDYIFFIDSDIVLNPNTINHLIKRNVDIVSNIFWSKWTHNSDLCPQVWLQDESNYYIRDWDKTITQEEMKQQKNDFINMLKVPGIYKVGGLGACTLISANAIKKGVNFSLINNISFWGEDRHFCIRAEALGLDLYVDTVYPAYHIYRESDLTGVENYKINGFDPNNFLDTSTIMQKVQNKRKEKINNLKNTIKYYIKRFLKAKFKHKRVTEGNTITVSMVVHNESNRYLERVLNAAKKYASNFVIIDDASTDNTVQICEDILKDTKHKIICNKQSLFKTEYKLRKMQWKETISEKPEWIMFLDADEEFEEEFNLKYKYLLNNRNVDVYQFRLYDMWNEKEYREDDLWNPNIYRPFLIRYQPKYKYKFKKTNQHCGRLPYNAIRLETINSIYRVKHYGWMKQEDRNKKYMRYKELDPNGRDGNIMQYESILDERPNLVIFDKEE